MSAPAPHPAKHVHQVFIVPGIVDEQAVRKQAFARANRARRSPAEGPEPTAIHKHKSGLRCNEDCYLIKVGDSD